MFEMLKQNVKIAHLNLREEVHGEDKVLAEDIKIQADMPNDFLSYLSPTLKWSLYDRPESSQGELIADASHMPRLRYPQLPPLRWEGRMEKAYFAIFHQPEGRMVLFEATIDKLVLDCKDGGTVSITFNAAVRPTPEETGVLAGMLGQEHKITVRPKSEEAEEAEQPDLKLVAGGAE